MEGSIVEFYSFYKVPYNFTGKCKTIDDGSIHYYVDGVFHRLDGPSIVRYDGTKEWSKDGFLHRLDGPAIEYSNGNKEFWIDGRLYPEKMFNALPEVIMHKAGLGMFL